MPRSLLLIALALGCAWCAPVAAQGKKTQQARDLVQRLRDIHAKPDAVVADLHAKYGAGDSHEDEDGHKATKKQVANQLLRRERKRVLKKLGRLGKAAEAPLLGAWKTLPDRDALLALDMITRIGSKRGLAALLQATKSNKLQFRRFAAGRLTDLAKHDLEKVVDAQLGLLQEEDGQTLQGVLGGLRALAPERAWDPLLTFVENGLRDDYAAADDRIGAAIRALGAILAAKPDPYRVEEVFARAGQLFEATERVDGSARLLDILTAAGHEAAAPYLRGLLTEAYLTARERNAYREESGLEGGVEAALESLDALRPFPPKIRSVAIVGLGAIKDKSAVGLLAKALKDTHDQPRRDAMSAISLIGPTGRERKDVFRNALRLLVHSDRVLRSLTHTFFQRASGKNLPLNYTAWRKWLEGDYLRVQVLECLQIHAEGSGYASVKALFAAEDVSGLDQWLERNEFADYRDFLDTSDLVPEDWPPEDYGEVPESELLRRYEE